MKFSNWLHGAWKGIASAVGSLIAAGAMHSVLGPHCDQFLAGTLCGATGSAALLTVWSGLAGVGISSSQSNDPTPDTTAAGKAPAKGT